MNSYNQYNQYNQPHTLSESTQHIKTNNEVKMELHSNKILPKQNNISFQSPIFNPRYGAVHVPNNPQANMYIDKYATRNQLIPNQSTQDLIQPNTQQLNTQTVAQLHRQYRVSRISVDSRYRNIDPKNVISSYIKVSNPFIFTAGSNILKIKLPTLHGINVDDLITISNVCPIQYTLRPSTLTLAKNSKYLYINHVNHGLTTSDIIKINGVENANITDYFFDNIPLSIINGFHQIELIMINDQIDLNNYKIDLGIYSNSNFVYTESPYTIDLMTVKSINLNLINASYPINSTVKQGSFSVYNSYSDYIEIQLTKSASASTLIGTSEGGPNIQIGKISSTISGYPDPGKYVFELKKTYYKVKKLRLVSTEIPNTEMLIKNTTVLKNNMFRWQILADGAYIYSIAISPGNYIADTLQTELVKRISETKRNFGSYLNVANYYEYCIPNITINSANNLFSIQIQSLTYLENSIVLSTDIYLDKYKRIVVTHPLHNLIVGDKITISNAINVLDSVISDTLYYVPTNVINSDLIIESVLGINNYVCKLPKYNPTTNGGSTISTYINGGNAIKIQSPLSIQLYFDQSDTFGNVLGFKNTGNSTSITIQSKIITNNTSYIDQSDLNSVGLPNTNVPILQFYTYPYILMVSEMFASNINYKNSSGVFAKLFLIGSPGSIIYDQYVQITEDLPPASAFLNELVFSFITPDGVPYDFNGQNHSYTLEIYEELEENPLI